MKLKTRYLSLFFLLFMVLGNSGSVFAQQFLQIEKAGRPRTEKMKIYDDLTFQLKHEKIWYNRQILGLNADAQLVQLGDAWLPVADITRIKLKRQRTWVNLIGGALQSGGAGMILGDAWYTLRNKHQFTDGGFEFGLLNIAVGTGLRALLAPIKYELGGRHRLRIVDLTFKSNDKL